MTSFIRSFTDKFMHASHAKYSEASLFPVLSADQLVIESERLNYLKKISELARIPKEHFNSLYVPLVNNYIEFVQLLPNKYGDELGSLMQVGLRHGYMALKLLRDTKEKKQDEPLYTYAVFSMCLLADVANVLATQKVMMSNEKGHYIHEWCPFNGLMKHQGEHYKVRPYRGHRQAFIQAANPMLAKSLMPEIGVAWLAQDSVMFDMWIAVLGGHEDWAGKLGHFKSLFKHFINQQQHWDNIVGMVPFQFMEPEDMAMAEAFWKWLKQGLEDGTISINEKDSKVHMTDEGLLLDTSENSDIFKDFVDASREYHSVTKVQERFRKLGFTQESGHDFAFITFAAQRKDITSSMGFLSKQQQTDMSKTQVSRDKAQIDKAAKGHQTPTKAMLIKDPNLAFKNRSSVPANGALNKQIQVSYMSAAVMPALASQQATVQAQLRSGTRK